MTALRATHPVAPSAPRQVVDDPALPGLARALDVRQVAMLLHRATPRFGGRQPELEIRYVRYNPGQGCRITYEAVYTSENGGIEHQLLYGRLDGDGGDGLAGHERERLRRVPGRDGSGKTDDGTGSAPNSAPSSAQGTTQEVQLRTEYRRAIVTLPAIPMVVRFFPHDPVLRRLSRLYQLESLKDIVEELLGRDGLEWKVRREALVAAILRYKPERRCVFRLPLTAHTRGGARRKQRLALYGHVQAENRGAQTFAVMRELAARGGLDGPLAVAKPVAYAPALELLLQEEITGTPLALHLERDDLKKIVRRLAVRLIEIQRSGVTPPRTVAVADQQDDIAGVARQLTAVPAVDAGRVRAVADALLATSPPPGDAPVSFIHGDFHHGQVLVKGRRSWIIDFERAGRGDPLIDVGAFLAHLELEALEGRLPAAPARRAIRTFRRAYADEWPEALDETRLRWQTAVHAFLNALAPLRQLQHDWPEGVRVRLDLARRIIDGEALP